MLSYKALAIIRIITDKMLMCAAAEFSQQSSKNNAIRFEGSINASFNKKFNSILPGYEKQISCNHFLELATPISFILVLPLLLII